MPAPQDGDVSSLPPTVSQHLATCYTNIIWMCLDSELAQSAVFFAERYYALDHNNHDARHIFVTTLLHAGRKNSALSLLRDHRCSNCCGCQHLKAQTCNLLGRHREAREALESSLSDPSYVPTPSMSKRTASVFPSEAARKCLSGHFARKGHLFEEATASYRQALALCPFLWEAFEGLCALGTAPEDIDDFFPLRKPPDTSGTLDSTLNATGPVATGTGFFTPEPTTGIRKPQLVGKKDNRAPKMELPSGSIASTDASFLEQDDSILQQRKPTRAQRPTNTLGQPVGTRPLSSADEGPATKRPRSVGVSQRSVDIPKPSSSRVLIDERSKKARTRPALTIANIFSSPGRRAQSVTTSSRLNTKTHREQPQNLGFATRRSTRLLGGATHKSSKAGLKEKKRQVARPMSPSLESEMDEEGSGLDESKAAPVPPSGTRSSEDKSTRQQSGDREMETAECIVYNTMRSCARAFRAFTCYDLQRCLDELEGLDAVQQRTPWVMALVGRAEYEKGDYAASRRAFESLRDLDPYRIIDMEVYSTLLWHTEKHIDLSFLAQELLSIEPRSPQTWIAIGNCFSLQKEKKQALTCFGRATQLDPGCAYAYTLAGHELVDTRIDQAINHFQSGIRADPRHYNAWYGLGTCYLRMNKVRMAEYHYRKAAEIHPTNAILIGCIGLTKERAGDNETAIQLYGKAIEYCPENALVRYRRGKLLIGMRQYKLAVQDLEFLRDLSPDESNVVFQLARAYRLLGNKVKSAQLLAVARDVSPKSVKKIERLLELSRDEDAEAMDED
ncbi:hypothetical protein BJ322DRAFT_1206970 [Thelephora terrestris]|uniref:TPR-like protein n=1 Tax=Thelephora terrestris TaxID=56493 RepID=A0A9P6HPD7_9AGAM|nr:hypothetical protein BJ322DRAFT_1206970 [Thelephora terrestris]